MLRVNSFSSLFLFVFCAQFILLSTSCTTMSRNQDTPEAAFSLAEEFDKDERYIEAITRYQDVKNKFPYSKYATMAELAIADAQFKQESFPEAQVAYQTFRDLHPKHPKIDYVTYQLAMSLYNQLPPTIDRDLSLSQNTIFYFDEVINKFSESDYAKDARAKKQDVIRMLAEKEQYIANFYFKQNQFDSALTRYENLLKKFPGQSFEAEILAKATISAAKSGEKEKSRKLLTELQRKFPNSNELDFAKDGVK